MTLTYPGLTMDLVNFVGWDAFLEALGDSSLCVHILDKVPSTMEEALRIALNLEALDCSREVETKVIVERQEHVAEETNKRKDKFVKVAAKPASGPAVEPAPALAVVTFADISHLRDTLANCQVYSTD